MTQTNSQLVALVRNVLKYPVDSRGMVEEASRNQFFRSVVLTQDNKMCFECQARNPTWLSLTYSVFLCLSCSGKHRQMGTHLSFVRSCELDQFSREQLVRICCGGNNLAMAYFKKHGRIQPGMKVDYSSKVAQKYKAVLDETVQAVLAQPELLQQSSASAALEADPNPPVPSPKSTLESEVETKRDDTRVPLSSSSAEASTPSNSGPSVMPTYTRPKHVPAQAKSTRSFIKARPLSDDFAFEEATHAANTQIHAEPKSNPRIGSLTGTSATNSQEKNNFASGESISSQPDIRAETVGHPISYKNDTPTGFGYYCGEDRISFSPEVYRSESESFETRAVNKIEELTDQARSTVEFLTTSAFKTANRARDWISSRLSDETS